MNVTTRALPTAFDPADGAVTVATPSCCCCCCCCLATVAATTAFTAGEAYYQAEEHGGSPAGALTVGLLAAPAGVIVGLASAQPLGAAAVGLGSLTFVAVTVAALSIAKVRLQVSLGIAVVVGAVALGALFAEFVGALFTLLLVELTAPLTAWGGWAIARGRHRRRAPQLQRWQGPEPAYPPISGSGSGTFPGGQPGWSPTPRPPPPPPPPAPERPPSGPEAW